MYTTQPSICRQPYSRSHKQGPLSGTWQSSKSLISAISLWILSKLALFRVELNTQEDKHGWHQTLRIWCGLWIDFLGWYQIIFIWLFRHRVLACEGKCMCLRVRIIVWLSTEERKDADAEHIVSELHKRKRSEK